MLVLLLACTGSSTTDDTAGAELFTIDATTDAGLYTISAWFDPDPVVGPQTVGVTATNADTPVTGATVTIVPWMPAHDHGVSDASAVVETDGEYVVTWTWPMAGAWEVTVGIDAEAGADSAVLNVDVE